MLIFKCLATAFALAVLQSCTPTPIEAKKEAAPAISLDFLRGNEPLLAPLSTRAFQPPGNHTTGSNHFEGTLTLNTLEALSQIEVLKDTYEIAGNESLNLTQLPAFSIDYVSDGADLIPLQREPQRGNHPYWEIIAKPGLSWDMDADNGWSRVALPFSLKEKNQNCIHNGLLTFLYKSDGSTSRAAWQITSETCLYLKVNLWGTVDTDYEPRNIPAADESVAAYRREIARRLPLKPLSNLTLDYPALTLSAFHPPGVNDATVYGLVMDGVHYRSDCATRFGPYPFCEVLDLPSYSLAKSLFGSLAFQLLSNRWPEFQTTPISKLVPECKTADKRWDDVTPFHLVNMTTGNYDSQVVNMDEDAEKMTTFFVAETHDEKVRFSCEAWPRKAKPGTRWAYHTTDTYLLGVAMNNFLKRKLGSQADIYRDVLYPEIIKQLDISPSLRWTQRTYDKTAQPFTGYGMVFHADDIARLAQALNSDESLKQYLDSVNFDSSRFRSDAIAQKMYDATGIAYSLGFWGIDASGWMPCKDTTWIPFMSGYGGITVAMFPNGGVYYYFTDSNQHGFHTATVEANKALNYCEE